MVRTLQMPHKFEEGDEPYERVSLPHKIVIKGLAQTAFEDKKKLNGIKCEDNFAIYLPDPYLKSVLEYGYMYFEYSDVTNQLFTVTEYTCKENLASWELKKLVNYTQNQWSAGDIGQKFSQTSLEIDNQQVFINPWCPEQLITTTQTLKQ
ncbi:hypothetical protein DLAC_08431 [Tieghemostelium lacteum]|uniref:Uncharacterized protein n=1 Tax=Tieghemostelium lacteum TaxID=361077 RepID=A0A151ZC61_TIELA|nr:hypothetical protein DLAC_08431 [Tieghemostelium lacteum]|eukprot:KYQ91464.1 hypothetical protein DLAC_08431 [Tieghemostelium lacteum]